MSNPKQKIKCGPLPSKGQDLDFQSPCNLPLGLHSCPKIVTEKTEIFLLSPSTPVIAPLHNSGQNVPNKPKKCHLKPAHRIRHALLLNSSCNSARQMLGVCVWIPVSSSVRTFFILVFQNNWKKIWEAYSIYWGKKTPERVKLIYSSPIISKFAPYRLSATANGSRKLTMIISSAQRFLIHNITQSNSTHHITSTQIVSFFHL